MAYVTMETTTVAIYASSGACQRAWIMKLNAGMWPYNSEWRLHTWWDEVPTDVDPIVESERMGEWMADRHFADSWFGLLVSALRRRVRMFR